jgi:hypothetical protein
VHWFHVAGKVDANITDVKTAQKMALRRDSLPARDIESFSTDRKNRSSGITSTQARAIQDKPENSTNQPLAQPNLEFRK